MEPSEEELDPKPIRGLLRRLAGVHVPRGDGVTFVLLAAVAALLMTVVAVTGVLLALYYRPAAAAANDSVRFVVTEVEYGGLVRSLHYWGAQALVVELGATIAWAALRRAYRAPHALAWISGVALALVAVAETFTGSLLPWSHRSVVDAQLSSSLAAQLPLLGPLLRRLMLGGAEPGDLSLVRILGLHAGVLPMVASIFAALLGLHAAGCAPRRPTADSLSLVPGAALRAVAVATVTGMALLVLSSFWPPYLGASAEVARASAAGLRPSWYLAFVHQMLRAAPPRMIGVPSAQVIVTGLVLGVAVLTLFPLFDRRASRAGQVAVLVALSAIVGGTIGALLH
jgi:ubiquinol-cytochrome c reductase cytochrome b subunit